MDTSKYLAAVLASQNLNEGSKELKELRAERDRVKAVLFATFPDDPPSIRYAGSYAKGTLNKESYDLDMTGYFPHDSTTAGSTLAEISTNVGEALAGHYYGVQPKTSALRLVSREQVYFHIDVVPGRFVDRSRTDVFLHQSNGTKERLKTNLDVHVDFIKGSGVVPATRLLKLWRTRRALPIKQFVFELLVIELLSGKRASTLDAQLLAFWEKVAAQTSPIVPEDPANPYGNDLSPLLTPAGWSELRSVAQTTLRQIENSGWEAVYGPVDAEEKAVRRPERFQQAAAVITNPTRPWASDK